eukprot:g43417.t1
MAVSCEVTRCRNSKQEGHLTKDRIESKSCNLSGEAGQLCKACPRWGGTTYPQMATSGNTGHGPPKDSPQQSGKRQLHDVHTSSSSNDDDMGWDGHQQNKRQSTIGEKERSTPEPRNASYRVRDTAPQQLQEMGKLVDPRAFDLVGGNDSYSFGLAILLRGGNFTISEVKEVVGGRLLGTATLRLLNVYTLVIKSECLAILLQLPLLLATSRLVILAGDFNYVFDKILRSSNRLHKLENGEAPIWVSMELVGNCEEEHQEVLYPQKCSEDRMASQLFLSSITEVLDGSMRERLDQLLFLDELTKVLKFLEKNKTPRSAGFPAELYLAVLDSIGQDLESPEGYVAYLVPKLRASGLEMKLELEEMDPVVVVYLDTTDIAGVPKCRQLVTYVACS